MRSGSRTVIDRLEGALEWRCIGPYRGGRVVAVAGDPADRRVFYFGSAGGGVWKSTDGGTYWQNVSDGYLKTASVGAMAVAPSDPNVVFVGMGETCIRNDVTHGDGVYRSTDEGATWKHVGLEDTRHISRVRVHPTNPDLVYVAAFGHAFGPSGQRGIFRSRDGGESWENVLYESEDAGAADLSIDPHNPRVLYASMWEARRSFWAMDSGGPGSGLHRSTDGGDTWKEITRRPGLPMGVVGRIGVAVSPARTGRVWALIEASDGGLFRSDDGGESWTKVNDSEDVRNRPWYYTHVFADPASEDTVYVLAVHAMRSIDGGKTFEKINMPHSDHHDLWIDESDPERMIEANDGGACVSYDGGDTWSSVYNQPTAQLYSVVADNQTPYRVYGAQQDNSAISVPSRSVKGFITWDDCHTIGLSESGKVAVKPTDSNVVYSSYPGGSLLRYDHRTGQVRVIKLWPEYYDNTPAKEHKYRFAWEFPIVVSPHDADTLYATGNMAFKSTDEGTTWEAISPDLTRNDPSKQELSGPITSEGPWAEVYCTIYAFAESPLERDLLWAGTDDGLVHVSRDGGKTWDDVTPEELPKWAMVSFIEPSSHEAGTAYMAATMYMLDDNRPFLFKTSDFGATWTLIVSGIADDDFTRVVREDTERPGLLYAGTETGVYFTTDDGENWHRLQLNLPVAPIYDLELKDADLVAATHGRSFWVLDDLTPLRQSGEGAPTGPHLFEPRPAIRFMRQAGSRTQSGVGKHYSSEIMGSPASWLETESEDGRTAKIGLDAGTNPPEGAAIDFRLDEEPEDEVSIEIMDASGTVIRKLSTRSEGCDLLGARQGLNRMYWDLRHGASENLPEETWAPSPFAAATIAPLAVPGRYTVRLRAEGEWRTATLEVLLDPRSDASQQDMDDQLALQLRIRDKYEETRDRVLEIRSLKGQVDRWDKQAASYGQAIREEASRIREKLSDAENAIVPFRPTGPQPRGVPFGPFANLKELMGIVGGADWRPTASSYELFDDIEARLQAQFKAVQNVIDNDIPAFTALMSQLGIPAISTA